MNKENVSNLKDWDSRCKKGLLNIFRRYSTYPRITEVFSIHVDRDKSQRCHDWARIITLFKFSLNSSIYIPSLLYLG